MRADGSPRRNIMAKVEVPTDGTEDRTGYELWVARRARDLLDQIYPGHEWFIDFDLRKGGMAIALPTLMGSNWVYFIRQKDLEPRRVLMAGGELLERYRMPRGRFELGSFLEARDKHSILLDKNKKVPG
jgi:hypothetical protein